MKAATILPALRGYSFSSLGPDVLAGLTLVAIAIPEQIATARLVGVPANLGLYAFVAGTLLFFLLGRDTYMSVGADSTIAPILASGVSALAAASTTRYSHLIVLLTLMVGVLLLLVGLLRLGWIAEYLSTPVVTGVLGGIALQILLQQIPTMFGLKGGGTTAVGRASAIIHQFSTVNIWSVAITLGSLTIIVAAEKINRRIPGALVAVVLSIIAEALLNLQRRGVHVIGSISGGAPRPSIPTASLTDIAQLIPTAITVAFICIMQSAATARASHAGAPAAGDFNRDIMAIGGGSIASSLFGSFAVDASPPRTEVVRASGGKSQFTGVVAVIVVLGVLLFATGLLKDLPEPTLAAILVFIAIRLLRLHDLRSILRFDRLEFSLAMIAMAAVALIGIEQGVVLAVVVSLADRTRRSARPRDEVLGREPGTSHWIQPDIGKTTETVPGMLVYQLFAPLWFANADYIRVRMEHLVAEAPVRISVLILDAVGVADIDYTGAKTLTEITDDLQRMGIQIAIARASHLVHHDLKRGGILQILGSDRLFASVEEAVEGMSTYLPKHIEGS